MLFRSDSQSVIKSARFHDRKHRSEDFFLRDSVLRVDITKDHRTDEESSVGSGHFQSARGFCFSHLNVLQDARFGFGIDQRSDGVARVFWRTDLQALRRLDEAR